MEHLSDDGILLLDVFNPHVAKLSRAATTRYRFKEIASQTEGRQFRVDAASQYFATEQILRFELFYLDHADTLLRTKRVSMRCIFPQELELLCKHCGMTVVQRFGNYDEQAFASGSPKQIIVCRKSDSPNAFPAVPAT